MRKDKETVEIVTDGVAYLFKMGTFITEELKLLLLKAANFSREDMRINVYRKRSAELKPMLIRIFDINATKKKEIAGFISYSDQFIKNALNKSGIDYDVCLKNGGFIDLKEIRCNYFDLIGTQFTPNINRVICTAFPDHIDHIEYRFENFEEIDGNFDSICQDLGICYDLKKKFGFFKLCLALIGPSKTGIAYHNKNISLINFNDLLYFVYNLLIEICYDEWDLIGGFDLVKRVVSIDDPDYRYAQQFYTSSLILSTKLNNFGFYDEALEIRKLIFQHQSIVMQNYRECSHSSLSNKNIDSIIVGGILNEEEIQITKKKTNIVVKTRIQAENAYKLGIISKAKYESIRFNN